MNSSVSAVGIPESLSSVSPTSRLASSGVEYGPCSGLARPRFEMCGNPRGPVVVVQGGISARAHVCAHPADPMPGWWDMRCGSGRTIDLERFRVVSIDFLENGATTDDQADAVALVLGDLGVERLPLFVGASYGAMVGLAFAVRHPQRLDKLVAISGAHRAHPFAAATRGIQRRIVALGARHGGESGALDGLALARELAMTTYRTPEEFDQRFSGSDIASGQASDYNIESGQAAADAYLARAGRRFAATFPRTRFLSLSRSLDSHRVDPQKLQVETLLIGVRGDRVVPIEDLRQLAAASAPWSRLVEIDSLYGHDAFLKETDSIDNPLRSFLGGLS